MDLEVLAYNLRFFRKSHGLTQADIASQLNIQRQSYCNYETARRAPNLELLSDIAAFYHVSLDFLVNPLPDPAHPGTRSDSYYSLEQLIQDYLSLSLKRQSELQHFMAFQKSQSTK